MSEPQRILVVGLGAGGAASLPSSLLERIQSADVLAGGNRHLQAFANFAGETLTITGDIAALVARLQQAHAVGKRVVVLASGDPLCYGIGASLRGSLAADVLEVVPAPTAFQQAFAALAEPWHDAALLSVHGRSLAAVVQAILSARVAAVLTDREHTPSVLAHVLLKHGMPADTACAVCENLGYAKQRVVHRTLGQAAEEAFAPLNVFVVWGEGTGQGNDEARGRFAALPGLSDDQFSTEAGLITQREVRLLTLAELALAPGMVLWDIGAGSGAVGIEAARAYPTLHVYAIEQREVMCQHIRENIRRHAASNVHLVEGSAPHICRDLPDPDAVFIGGSGGQLEPIITTAQQRMLPGGRMVINLVTLENLHVARAWLPAAQVVQVQVNQGVPIRDMLRFEARNPVFVVTWSKPCD
jgi:precorrin-6Y C5,15-methyltransferase (decarboxylating)